MILTSLIDWLFPRCCYLCGQGPTYLCDRCQAKIKPLETGYCPVCNRPSPQGLTHPRCRRRWQPDGLLALFPYQPPLSSLLKELKYQRYFELAPDLARLAGRVLTSHPIFSYWSRRQFYFLAIPLFPQRQEWRGFNQSQLILDHLGQQLSLPILRDCLIRVKWTRAQAQLSARERRANLRQSFRLNSGVSVQGLNLVIFDDVWTTGATLRAAIRVLKQKGAAEVWGLTLFGRF